MTSSIKCNFCGKPLDLYDMNQRLVIHTRLGYGSKYDGETVAFHMCCECFDKLIEICKISPITGE